MGYTIPIGPYHPSLEEPVYAKLYTEGEIIKDADVYIGYNHRGVEKLATEKNFIQTLALVERVCGICSHSHPFAYCLAIENIAGMEVPKRGQYIRVITAELERLHSHFLWLGVAAHIIGFDSVFMFAFNAREKVMDALEILSGNRVNYGMNIIGGVRRDIDTGKKEAINKAIDDLWDANDSLKNIFLKDKTAAMRTKGIGIIKKEDALKLGIVGPHMRASGIEYDVRVNDAYSCYEDFDFNISTYPEGDVFSRIVVRILENYESIKIIRQALEKLPEGSINLGIKIPKVPAGEFVSRVEAPRGQVVYYVVTDGGPKNYRVSIHVPTFRNAASVPFMLKGNSVADASLIIACIDPCFSCLDR
ncbi:MAG: nickel-dependent hydrogenase large subunit [Clostridiales bacterium]|nr:nickel-dependent hydrogenase large subunit [Clostridiales bacterium]HBM81860.1 NADH dehydrogenase subunit [Clostridiaceae bacterium]